MKGEILAGGDRSRRPNALSIGHGVTTTIRREDITHIWHGLHVRFIKKNQWGSIVSARRASDFGPLDSEPPSPPDRDLGSAVSSSSVVWGHGPTA